MNTQHLWQPGTRWAVGCQGGQHRPLYRGVSVQSKPWCSPKGCFCWGKKKIQDCHFRMQFNEMNSISSCLASPDILPSIPYINILMECELWAPKERQFVLCSRTCQAIITAWVIHQNDRKWLGISRGTNQAVCFIPLVLVSDTNKITPFLSKLSTESLWDGKKIFQHVNSYLWRLGTFTGLGKFNQLFLWEPEK